MKNQEFNLTQYIIQKNQNNLNKVALIYIEDENEIIQYTYEEVFLKIFKIASFLISFKNKDKIQKVLLRMPSNPNVIFYFFGSILSGFVPIPISRMLTINEVDFIIKDSKPEIIIYEELDLPSNLNHIKIFHSKEILESNPKINYNIPTTYSEDPAFIIYTSGTTGYPKGVIHAQRNILGRIPIQKEWLDIHSDDILLHAGELNWTYTLGVGIMDVWSHSGTSILVGKGRNYVHIWTWILRHFPVTIFATVPSLYRRILKYFSHELKNLKYLRHGLTAGESFKPELYKTWINITEKPLYEALGMSEISTYISSGPNVPTKPGSPGKPQKGRKVQIISIEKEDCKELPINEIGYIAVHRSDLGLMLGYLNRPEEEQSIYRQDWFIGGDLAYKDEEGYYWFVGRNNDLMKSFGYRVSPLEVENVLSLHPNILESAVCEIQFNNEISLITAFVVLDREHSQTEKEVINFCKKHLAEYKCPRRVIFLKELPRNSSGKILKNILKQEYNYKI